MAAETIHLIVRRLADTYYGTSPQAPGLAYGRSTLAELRADLDGVLSFHLDQAGPFIVAEHEEQHHEVGDRELVIRLAMDEHRRERKEVRERLRRALAVPEQAEALITGPVNRVGEVLYISVVPSDTLSWVVAQMDPRGETATIAVAVGDELLLTFRVSTGGEGPIETRETVADLMRTQPILQPVPTSLAV